MAISQSDMLRKEVYLFERIDSGRSNERLKYLKCIVFIRPTKDNILRLSNELKSPKYVRSLNYSISLLLNCFLFFLGKLLHL